MIKQTNKALSQRRNKVKEIAYTFQCQLLENQYLKQYTTMGIGGLAPFIIFPSEKGKLEGLLLAFKEESIPWRILGAGSNLIVDDIGIKDIIINLSRMDAQPCFEGEKARVPAGYRLGRFIVEATHRGLGGVERLSGIPGSIGGAIKMNASSFGGSISEIISGVELISTAGKREQRSYEKLDFAYRSSDVKQRDIILAADFSLKKKEPKDIKAELEYYATRRRATQPLGEKSAGCIFKNPPGYSAGQLIEELGLKGRSSGGAVISEKHANFIINREQARFEDVMRLIDMIKNKTKKHSGIDLEEEVEIWRQII